MPSGVTNNGAKPATPRVRRLLPPGSPIACWTLWSIVFPDRLLVIRRCRVGCLEIAVVPTGNATPLKSTLE